MDWDKFRADYIKMGSRIKEKREVLKLTREALAEKMGVSTKFLADIENGVRNPSLDTFMKLAISLNTTMDYLYFGKPAILREITEEEYTDFSNFVRESNLNVLQYLEDMMVTRRIKE